MRPAQPPAYDPNDSRYWDGRDLEGELERVFSVCHGCRMCVGYCPSFPELFRRVDGYVDRGKGEIDAFIDQDYEVVNDLCYQCKICHLKCPYTPEDGHPFQLDFPKLMLRHRAQRAARNGVSLQDQVLGEPQLLGRMGAGPPAPMANFVSKNALLRKVQEKVTGISAHFNLPPFAEKTLGTALRERSPSVHAHGKQIAFFPTCTVSFNLPTAGIAAFQVLEHNGFDVSLVAENSCCGMPNLDGGDVAAAQKKAARNVAALYPYAAAGKTIVVPGPTCSYVLKHDYVTLLGTEEAATVAAHTEDLMEFLRRLHREGSLKTDFVTPLGKIAYHAPCHLRAQRIGFPAAQVLSSAPGTEVEIIEKCSAVDGTWGMKEQYFELGRRYAAPLIAAMQEVPTPRTVATDCPLAGQRLAQELGTRAVHPIELLNMAYGLPNPAGAR